jgi:tetratricopeptide (TPR) repeat protein
MPQLAAGRSRNELEERVTRAPDDWHSRMALARLYDTEGKFGEAVAQLETAARLSPRESSIPFLWGLILLHQNQKTHALTKLKAARDLDPENWRIHKQIWAIEHPDKFYSGDSPDFSWQKDELAREKNAKHADPAELSNRNESKTP